MAVSGCPVLWQLLFVLSPVQMLHSSNIFGTITIEGGFLLSHVLVHTVFKDVPRFETGGQVAADITGLTKVMPIFICDEITDPAFPKDGWRTGLVDFIQVMLPDLAAGSALFALAVRLLADDPLSEVRDLSAASTMIRPGFVYSMVHRTHHEHVSPSLWTNYHFSLADLILEAFAPFAIALIVMHTILGLHTTQHELFGLLSYTMWFEIGSHCGKSLPVLTWMPPISPILRLFVGDVDDSNALFHHSHHTLVFCNYGISQWTDHLMGTAKFDKAKPKHTSSIK
eukprot:gene9212-2633_t